MRRETSLRPTRHHKGHTRFDYDGWDTEMARQTGAETRRGEAAREIIDAAVALCLAQHRDNGFRADEPVGNGGVEDRRIGWSGGREAVDSSEHQHASLRVMAEKYRGCWSLASAHVSYARHVPGTVL